MMAQAEKIPVRISLTPYKSPRCSVFCTATPRKQMDGLWPRPSRVIAGSGGRTGIWGRCRQRPRASGIRGAGKCEIHVWEILVSCG